ncbi:histone deacetylase 6 [Emydura macquarii macquarii]|uniref:histone deacetylase 6 n=1 Tax=Emydura macquarii macquarii TaxID=1129001 RepID=UPI00352ADC22
MKRGGRRGPQPRCSPGLPETKRRGRAQRTNRDADGLESGLQRLDLGVEEAIPAGTGLAFDEQLTQFRCLWDDSYPECPERLAAVKEKLLQQGLWERCVPVEARLATEEEILLAHSQGYVELMKTTARMGEAELRALSDTYDSVFLHPDSYQCARLASGCLLQVLAKVLSGELRNGLALIRPPGHHAHRDKMDGYCMFNHLGIAARYAQQKLGVERVLIVDWDVHRGQGTPALFLEDPSVLCFSIHRAEEGTFWPHLPESDSPAVGTGRGEGFNISVPWSAAGMRDGDYLAAFLHILLPVAFEFQPQLVLVAAGFDAVRGDPKGQMAASPACFAHLTHLLMALAGGKVLLSLEGGYNLDSLAEGVSAALRILLGDPCPRLELPVAPCRSALSSVSRTLAAHEKYWRSLRRAEADPTPQDLEEEPVPVTPPDRPETAPPLPAACTGLVYDERMTGHYNMWDSQHPELPQRVSRIFQRHEELRLAERCRRIPARSAEEEELSMCHCPAYVQTVKATAGMTPRELHRQGDQYNSIYICASSYECARLAAGSAFNAVQAVLEAEVRNAVAIVRPPGHHAEPDTACGFCFFNSVALAARFAQRLAGRPMRVMILDWDVHHGNGTQHMFEEDPSVLYVSLHRYDHGSFFPMSEDADADHVGRGPGRGFNLNVPWNGTRMGDPEYLAAFHRLVLPVAYQFDPELVLVSAGFDAARGDPLGGCLVSPECYAHMTHALLGLAGGRVVLVLEGGYNLASISESMTMCTRTLLGDPLPELGRLRAPHPSALQSLAWVGAVHRKYWSCLQLEEPTREDSRPRSGQPSPVQEGTQPETPSGGSRSPPASEASVDDLMKLGALCLSDAPADLGSPQLSPDSAPMGGESPGRAEPLAAEESEGPPSLQDEAAAPLPSPAFSLEVEFADTGTLFAVTPLPWCPHLDSVRPVPPAGLDVLAPCEACGSQAENWVCLACYQVLCGRYVNQHMLAHGSLSGHPLVLSYSDLSVWCYACQSYVHHPVLLPAKALAHHVKFSVDLDAGL